MSGSWHRAELDLTDAYRCDLQLDLPEPADSLQITIHSQRIRPNLPQHLLLPLDRLQRKVIEQVSIEDTLGKGSRKHVVLDRPRAQHGSYIVLT